MSARRENGLFDFRNRNSLWEQLTLDRAEFEFTEEYFPPMMLGSPEGTNKRAPSKEISPKVSVIIPMYNAEKYIEACLDSILNQTFQDYEVIIVDDCSTDRSAEIVESMSERFDGRLTLIRLEKNNGEPGTPRNIGINYAVGKYVYFVDSDDMMMEQALELLYATAEKYNADVVHTTRCYTFRENKNQPRFDKNDVRVLLYRSIDGFMFEQYDVAKRVVSFSRRGLGVAPYNHFLRRDLLVKEEIVFAPTFSVDDTIFALFCMCRAKIYVHISDIVYFYRRRDASLTMTADALENYIRKQIKVTEIVFKMLKKFMSKQPCFEKLTDYRYVIYRYFFNYCVRDIAHSLPHYENNAASAIHTLVYENIARGVNFSDEMVAIFLALSNSLDEQLADRDRKIKSLKAELARLKATKNPAE